MRTLLVLILAFSFVSLALSEASKEQTSVADLGAAYEEEVFSDESEDWTDTKKENDLKEFLTETEALIENNKRVHSLSCDVQEHANWAATQCFDELSGENCENAKKNMEKPHIIFFLVDDLGYNDVPWTNSEVKAPYLMDLATNGVILENYYAQPLCSPSRGALMTGNYPWRSGMQHDVITYTVPECAPKDMPFISEKLKGTGYTTHMVGKWHLGFCNVDCTPTYRGFDSFFGFYQGYIDHYSHTVADGYDWWDNVAGGGEQSRKDLDGQYAGDLLTERAVELINNHDASSPMFMYFSHSGVHSPIQAPDKYTSQYPGLDNHRATYLGMVTGIDDTVKQVTDSLKAKGMYENTVIIFTSDNGAEFRAGSNGNLRGSKTTFYEAGIKVPGFIHSPLIEAHGRNNGLMHISDWHATILSMVGLDNSGIDGVDQTELLFKNGSSARDEIIYQIDSTFPQFFGSEAIRVGDYKLLRGFPGLFDGYESDGSLGLTHVVNLIGADPEFISHSADHTLKSHNEELNRGKRPMDWLSIAAFVRSVAGTVQLYNIAKDPEERYNLADVESDIAAKLFAKLDAARITEKIPDLKAQVPIQAGEASNFGGIWTPGWC